MSWPTMQDYQEAIQTPEFCFADPELKQGKPVLNSLGLPRPITGGFASVYQVHCGDRKYAVRCFLRNFPDLEWRYPIISDYIRSTNLPYMVRFEFIRQGILVHGHWYPILKMEWVEGDTLNIYLERNLQNSITLQSLAGRFLKMNADLKQVKIAHGDLQHGNILIVDNEIKLIDYDGMYVPGLDGMMSNEVGQRNYQHPVRTQREFGPYLDNFSSWVIYLSLMALSFEPELWDRVTSGDECLLFRREDFEQPEASDTIRLLGEIPFTILQGLLPTFKSLLAISKLEDIVPIEQVLPATVPETTTILQKPKSRKDESHAASKLGAVSVGNEKFKGTPWPERGTIISFIALAVLLVFTASGGTLPILLIPVYLAIGAGGLAVLISARYRRNPKVIEKNYLNTRLHKLKKEVEEMEKSIDELGHQKKELEAKKTGEMNGVISLQRECDMREKAALYEVDQKLQRKLKELDEQQQRLYREERDKLNNTLNEMVVTALVNRSLDYGAIPGVPDEFIWRLSSQGLRRAFDIADIRMDYSQAGVLNKACWIVLPNGGNIYIQGVETEAANSLLNWRQNEESRLRIEIANNSFQPVEAQIRTKYLNLRKQMDEVAMGDKRRAGEEKMEVLARYKNEKDALAANMRKTIEAYARLTDEIDERIEKGTKILTEKFWSISELERRVKSYQTINFPTYLRRLAFIA